MEVPFDFVAFEEMIERMSRSPRMAELLDLIRYDEECLTKKGRLNKSEIGRKMGCNSLQIDALIKQLQHEYQVITDPDFLQNETQKERGERYERERLIRLIGKPKVPVAPKVERKPRIKKPKVAAERKPKLILGNWYEVLKDCELYGMDFETGQVIKINNPDGITKLALQRGNIRQTVEPNPEDVETKKEQHNECCSRKSSS